MRKHRVAAMTAVLVSLGAALVPLSAQAAVAGTFYVGNLTAGACSDSTSNSVAEPYCTIQGAVNAATTPGDTVIVRAGSYAPFKVSASGSATAPITIEGVPTTGANLATTITTSSAVPISVVGASYVDVDGFAVYVNANYGGVAVSDSSHVTLDRDDEQQNYTKATGAGVSITGGSSDVTVSRNWVSAYSSEGGIYVDGGSGDVITTNILDNVNAPAAALVDSPSSELTSNYILATCKAGISLTSGSKSASVENNVGVAAGFAGAPMSEGCVMPTASQYDLLVDSSSATGTTEDYNNFATNSTSVPDVYSWAGSEYADPASFTAATEQGAHDLNTTAAASAIDSANSDAPGEMPTDFYDNAHVDDPNVADTGAGTYTYYDRGTFETDDPLAATFNQANPTLMPVSGSGTFSATVTDSWDNAITECAFDFGDGTSPVTVAAASGGVCAAPHAYAKTGQYTVTLTAEASDGYGKSFTTSVSVDTVSAFTPILTLDAYGTLGLQLYASDSDDWSLASCTVDYGDGTTKTIEAAPTLADCYQSHSYASAGTYTVTATLTDAGGNQRTVSQSFVTGGSGFTPVTPKRILDTRDATGVTTKTPVASDGVVKLKIAGTDGLPDTGVTAVALNLTATGATKIGYLTAYPDGASVPDTSNVDFAAGKNIANTVIVQVGADGYVDVANESSGTTHVVADLEGYYSAAGTSGYDSVAQERLLDTRKTKTPIPAGGSVRLDLGADYPGISAAVLNVTALDETGNGYVTAYPDGGVVPATSNVNYLTGQILPNEVVVQVGSDGYVDFADTGKGGTDLLVDISGYFTVGSGAKFVPITPLRYLDTRNDTGEVDNGFEAVTEAGPGSVTDLDVGGIAQGPNIVVPVPSGVSTTAVAANVTETQPTANGYIGVFPPVSGLPTASVLNFRTGQQTQNAVTVGLGTTDPFGDFDLYNSSNGSTQLIVDVYGYYNS